MATNGGVKAAVILLSLVFPVIAHTEYYNRPTSKMRVRQHMSDPPVRNRYSDTNSTNFHTRSTHINPEYQRDQAYDGQIVYPEEPKTTCTYGLCTNVGGYPKDKIKKLLNRSQLFDGYFEEKEETIHLDNRFGSDESMCDTMTHTIYPEKANNTNQIEKIIVNVEGHKQGIVFETCVDNGQCKFSSSFPEGYTSYCKQKYIHKRLMVLGDNDKFVFDSFEVPSCCVCTVKKPPH